MLSTAATSAAAGVDTSILDKAGDLDAFRTAVRTWLEEVTARRRKLDQDGRPSFYDLQQWWMAERNKVGLGTPHWPVKYGGSNISLACQVTMSEELARARVPAMSLFTVSLNHVFATLSMWGTEEQKTAYLPEVAKGAVWCQGFSEPGAGSDLASLRTRAVRDGDHYVVNGQKIWSSYSMYAGHCILLARTNADPEIKKQAGISYFLMDMTLPGVEVRPIKQSNGDAEFAELFLTDVSIPVSQRVGEEGEGWKVAQSTLAAERGVLAFEAAERLRYDVEEFYAAAVECSASWLQDAEMRREFMRLFGEVQACRKMFRRLLREAGQMSPEQAATVPQVKVINTALRKAVGDFMVRASGMDAQIFVDCEDRMAQPVSRYVSSFGGAIAGGSNEIMRNIIAERVLGMPRR
ncbi:hypothetical protein LK12_23135 [Novosphingobium malaysiense]|uniref:Acyl-CoA dehydrogenase n=2 Tax=Novosphingobium malaysiense TaxID=1348853 RepID=A0A0B1ZI48_9SPHN|nr:hypothetical protein LK12_23135 [Novosphingobium malaysiense]